MPYFFRRLCLLLAMLCLVCSCGGCSAETPEAFSTGTRLIALNVGKSDCLLLLFENQAYLIDSGWERAYNTLREALRQYGITRLNGVFLTHCDKDHYGGLMQLAQSGLAVDAWYAAAIYHDVKPGEHPMELACAARGETVRYLSAGDVLPLSDAAVLTVLGPLVRNTENENNNSLVFSVETADGTLLFTGDMKLDEERSLLEAGVIPRADVLKVPFHGDSSASGEAFIQTVSPQVAVICTATQEEPDTPSPSTLKRYGRMGVQCAVTQDYTRGIEVTLRNGRASLSDIVWDTPDYSASVRAAISLDDDMLTLRNSSAQDITLTGWAVYSSRGETFVPLPEGSVLPANGVFKIGTRATAGDVTLRLDSKRLWHKSRYDRAVIYDAAGCIVAVTDNGMPE